jgi:hypothetical protein
MTHKRRALKAASAGLTRELRYWDTSSILRMTSGAPSHGLQNLAYIDARPQSRQIDETSCDARPDHTFGSDAAVVLLWPDSAAGRRYRRLDERTLDRLPIGLLVGSRPPVSLRLLAHHAQGGRTAIRSWKSVHRPVFAERRCWRAIRKCSELVPLELRAR